MPPQQRETPLPDDLPIGAVVDKNGLIISIPGRDLSSTGGAGDWGDVGTGLVKSAAGTAYETGKTLGQGLQAINPAAGPLLLMNKLGILPEQYKRLLPIIAPGYIPPAIDEEVETKLKAQNAAEFGGRVIGDVATAAVGGAGGRARDAFPIVERGVNRLISGVTGRGANALTPGEVAQARSVKAFWPTQRSVRKLDEAVRTTTPPPNPSPINMRQIYKQEVPKKKGKNSRSQATPDMVTRVQNRLNTEQELRQGTSPFQAVRDKIQGAADAPSADFHFSELGAMFGYKPMIPSGGYRLANRPLPRAMGASALNRVGAPALFGASAVGGKALLDAAEEPVEDPFVRQSIIEQLGGGPRAGAGAPPVEPLSEVNVPLPSGRAASPPPAAAAIGEDENFSVAPFRSPGEELEDAAPPAASAPVEDEAAELAPPSPLALGRGASFLTTGRTGIQPEPVRFDPLEALSEENVPVAPFSEENVPVAPFDRPGRGANPLDRNAIIARLGAGAGAPEEPTRDLSPEQQAGVESRTLLKVRHAISGAVEVIPNTYRAIEQALGSGWNIERTGTSAR